MTRWVEHAEDGTPVALPTGAINFGEPGTNGSAAEERKDLHFVPSLCRS